MFGRRHKNRRELVHDEFSQSLDHFRRAAAHAAGGVGASVGPTMGTAKEKVSNARGAVGPTAAKAKHAASSSWESTIAALVPLADAAKEGAAKASKLPPYKKEAKPVHWYSRNSAPKTKVKVKAQTSEGNGVSGAIFTLLAAGAAIGATSALVARRRNRAHWADYEPESVRSDADQLIDSTKSTLSTGGGDHPDVTHKMAAWAKEHMDSLRHKIHEATADHPESKIKSTANDLTDKAGKAKDKIADGASHLKDKSEAQLNDASSRRGTMSKASDSVTDEVDDLLRSSRNGRL